MNPPFFSIITPSFNQAKFLAATLESVLSQDFRDFEYIVVDGQSTDGSIDILRSYQGSLTEVIVEKDSGQAQALNKGFRRAHGKFITWLNSDDLLVPGALRAIHRAWAESPKQSSGEPAAEILVGDIELFCEAPHYVERVKQRGINLENLVEIWDGRKIEWAQPGIFVSRQVLEQSGELDESLHYCFDREWLCRVFQHSSAHYIRTLVARYRLHGESKTVAHSDRFLAEHILVTERYAGLVPGLNIRRGRAELTLVWGALPCLNKRFGKQEKRIALGHLMVAIRHYPQIFASRRFALVLVLLLLPGSIVRFLRKVRRF